MAMTKEQNRIMNNEDYPVVTSAGPAVQHASLTEALAAAQGEFPAIPKSKTATVKMKTGGQFSYKYADLADVIAAIAPVLSKHGIAYTQRTIIRDGHLLIKTVLFHGVIEIESEYPVCEIGNDHQAMGGAMTYARRYALTSLVGVMADEDTDGQGAAASGSPARGSGRKAAQETRPVDPPVPSIEMAASQKQFDKLWLELADAADIPSLMEKWVKDAGEAKGLMLPTHVDQLVAEYRRIVKAHNERKERAQAAVAAAGLPETEMPVTHRRRTSPPPSRPLEPTIQEEAQYEPDELPPENNGEYDDEVRDD